VHTHSLPAATLAASTSLDRHTEGRKPKAIPISLVPRARNSDAWREASRQHPCPCCGATRWCSSTTDGQAAVCRKSDGTAPSGWRVVKPAPQGGHVLLRVDPLWQSDLARLPDRARLPKPKAGHKLTSQQCLELLEPVQDRITLPQVARLAEQLRVSVDVLRQMGVGWRWGDVLRGQDLEAGEWMYPMRDGSGQVVGVHRRLAKPYTQGDRLVGKLTVPGSTSGLFYAPDAWAQGSGPVLVVEGMTDTAAALHAGLAAVGRPSNTGGAEQLAVLLEQLPADRPILLVGENDAKADGRCPGREGAEQVAQRLADALDRAVLWSMVPAPAKDAREYLTSAAAGGLEPEQAGRMLAAELLEHATAVQPASRDPELDGRVPAEDPVPMAQLRQQLRARMLQLAEPPLLQRARPDDEHPEGEPKLLPAVYMCGAPTGAGKSRAALELAQRLEQQGLRVAYLSQTHRQSAERLAEGQGLGLEGAAADPELTPQTCGLWHVARRARACGLSVSQVICPGCPLREACLYQQQKATAKDAPVRFACHAQGAQDLSQVAAGRDALIIDEDALGAMVRHEQVKPRDVIDVIRCLRASAKAHPSSMQDAECQQALELLTQAAAALIRALRGVQQPGAVRVDISGLVAPAGDDDDAAVRWGSKVWRILGGSGDRVPAREAMSLLMDVITGRMSEVWVMHDRHATGAWDRQLVGIQRHRVPRKMVLMLDATADPGTLERMIDASGTGWTRRQHTAVQVITPPGRAPDEHAARRLVPAGGDVLVGSTAERATEVLRGAMARIPEQRLGLICHGGHLDEMCGRQAEGDGLLDDAEMRRLMRVAGHHTADVRGSNSWISGDDDRLEALIVLGCPNVPPSAVRLRLLATGQHEAAAQPDGGWLRHQVLSTAPDGSTLTNPTMGCTDPVWQEARRQLVHAALHQEGSRARHTLPEGIPVYVITTEPMPGILTEPDPLLPIDEQTHYLVQEVARLVAPQDGPRQAPDQGPEDVKMGNPARVKSLKYIDALRGFDPRDGSVSTGHLVGHLEGLGWSSSTAKRALARAALAGLLTQPTKGRWALPPAPSEQPPASSAPPPAPAPAADLEPEPVPEGVISHPAPQQAPEATQEPQRPVLEVRPHDRPATVIRTGWQPTASTTTNMLVTMPTSAELARQLQPPPLSIAPRQPPPARPPAPARASPSDLMQEVARAHPDPAAVAWLLSSTPDEFDAWLERAAIHEHDGGLPKTQAEVVALAHLYAEAQRQPPAPAATPPPRRW
jgi:hypothetical protein